jgi:adenylylsulfate kinase
MHLCRRVTQLREFMVIEDHGLLISAIVALNDAIPRVEECCILIASEHRAASAKLVSVARLAPDHGPGASPDRRSQWSQLASIEMEVSGLSSGDLMVDGRATRVELCDATTGKSLAVGLTVACRSKNAAALIEPQSGSRGLTIWLTGLSGAGKTTIAAALVSRLQECRVEHLDADIVRTHICKGLGFAREDRMENVRRLALLAGRLAENSALVIVSAISPYREAREDARRHIGRFIEVYVNAALCVCEGRDVKGLYKRARSGEIQSFTGIDDPYDPPVNPEVECHTDTETVDESVTKIMAALAREGRHRLEPPRST